MHAEAANVEKVVTHLVRGGVSPTGIGVITPYEGQRAHMLAVMQRQGTLGAASYQDVEVSSVDAFQVVHVLCPQKNVLQMQGLELCSAPVP